MPALYSREKIRICFQVSDYDLFKDLKVLNMTEGDIPNDAIAVQPSMDDELKDKIKEVFLNMADDEEGKDACLCGDTPDTARQMRLLMIPLRNIPIRLLNNIQVRKENQ